MIGGALPAALAADWLTSAWDQNAGLFAPAPAAAIVEEVAGEWLREPLRAARGRVVRVRDRLPDGARDGARRGAREHVLRKRAAGTVGRAAALRRAGDPRRRRREAPRYGRRALRLLGMGAPDVVPADDQGRMVVDELELDDRPTIVCAQVGEVNTGAFDDIDAIADPRADAGAWLHVDGAFGLWAGGIAVASAPRPRRRARRLWATDAHKWLNVPYDSGLAFCAHPAAHRRGDGRARASTSCTTPARTATSWTGTRSSRAGRAAFRSTRRCGRSGARTPELVERCCAHARQAADGLARAARCGGVERGRPEPGALPARPDERTQERATRGAAGAARSGSAARPGTAARRSASRSRTGRRRRTTSTARRLVPRRVVGAAV